MKSYRIEFVDVNHNDRCESKEYTIIRAEDKHSAIKELLDGDTESNIHILDCEEYF